MTGGRALPWPRPQDAAGGFGPGRPRPGPADGQEGAGLRGDDDAGDPADLSPHQVSLWGVPALSREAGT